MDHAVIGVFEQRRVFGRHRHRGTVVIHCLHPREEFGVEDDRVAMRGQLGADFGVDFVEPVGGVRPGHGEEHARHAAEHAARLFQRHDGVFHRRRGGVVDDRLDFGLLDGHALLERGDVIVFGDLREIGRLERQRAVRGEIARAARDRGGVGAGCGHGVEVFPICGGATGEQCCGCDGGQNLGLHACPLRMM